MRRLFRLFPVLLPAFLFCSATLTADPAKVDKPATPSPMRLVPAEADVFVHIDNPRKLVETVQKLDTVQELLKLTVVKEALDATAARRARQLLTYFEKTLGAKYPEALDKLAGGGIALGATFGGRSVLVIQGTDAEFSAKAFAQARQVIESELVRQESKLKIAKDEYHGIECYKIGDALFVRLESTIVIASHKETMTAALDLHRNVKDRKSMAAHVQLAEAARLLPESCLARAWLNMKPAHASEGGKALYMEPRDNSQLTVLFGGYIDILGRAPWICAGLAEEKDGFLLTIRAPRGRDGMGADRFLHLPPADQAGSLPLLEPKNVLYSSSFYLDLANLWKERERLLPKVQADGMTAFDKTSGRVLGGVKMSSLFESVGAYHRIVVTNQGKTAYTRKPRTSIPAFAFVAGLRNEERFGRGMDTLLRVGTLALTQQFKMELSEEKHKEVEIVGYRFDEKAELKDDIENFRFNFSPCFARVGKQFIFCSTIELCRELIDLLEEEKAKPARSKATTIDRFYSTGFASLLEDQRDALITQTILDQAVPPAEAHKQVAEFIKLVRRLGTVDAQTHIEAKKMQYDIFIRLGAK